MYKDDSMSSMGVIVKTGLKKHVTVFTVYSVYSCIKCLYLIMIYHTSIVLPMS